MTISAHGPEQDDGKIISLYEILEKRGKGSVGVVYEALDTTLEDVPAMAG